MLIIIFRKIRTNKCTNCRCNELNQLFNHLRSSDSMLRIVTFLFRFLLHYITYHLYHKAASCELLEPQYFCTFRLLLPIDYRLDKKKNTRCLNINFTLKESFMCSAIKNVWISDICSSSIILCSFFSKKIFANSSRIYFEVS